MTEPERAVFLVQRIGPYHHARLQAFAALGRASLEAIEFRASETVYAWEDAGQEGRYRRQRVETHAALLGALDAARPQVVVCVGYADPEIHAAANWALGRRIPLVTCSDSTYDDEPRDKRREALKRILLRAFSSALVSGLRAREYLGSLGLGAAACFQPWDVVDNAYFARGAASARGRAAAERRRLGLPESYFLCVARFVAKKNLEGLIGAYARYAAAAGPQAWSLVLSGSGPLEAELRARAAAGKVADKVRFTGLVRYPELPACYGLAEAFILPSTADQWGLVVNEAMAAGLPVLVSARCGCAPDLVQEGRNGRTFDPADSAALAARLREMAAASPEQRAAMGAVSREIVRDYSPEAFARGLWGAIITGRSRRPPVLTRALLALAARRRVPPSP